LPPALQKIGDEHPSRIEIELSAEAGGGAGQGLGPGGVAAAVFVALAQLGGAFAHFFFQSDILILKPPVQGAGLQEVPDAQGDFGGVEGFGQEVHCPAGEGALLGFSADVGGQHQDGPVIAGRYQRLERFHDGKAVQVGHHQVEQDQIRLPFLKGRDGLPRVGETLVL